MKHLFSFLFCLFAFAALSTSARAQAVSSAAFGSTVAVYSGHTTVRERVDAGVNERIELWNRTWIVSPSAGLQQHRPLGLQRPRWLCRHDDHVQRDRALVVLGVRRRFDRQLRLRRRTFGSGYPGRTIHPTVSVTAAGAAD
jgi:hypothetical protein